MRKDCQQMASKGLCNSKTQFRTMLGECCATCNSKSLEDLCFKDFVLQNAFYMLKQNFTFKFSDLVIKGYEQL